MSKNQTQEMCNLILKYNEKLLHSRLITSWSNRRKVIKVLEVWDPLWRPRHCSWLLALPGTTWTLEAISGVTQ